MTALDAAECRDLRAAFHLMTMESALPRAARDGRGSNVGYALAHLPRPPLTSIERQLPMPHLALLCLLSIPPASEKPTPFEIADALDLVPTPRAIELTGDEYAVDRLSIVAKTDRELIATGVRDVNDRVWSLGSQSCPVGRVLPTGNVLVLATCDMPWARQWVQRLGITPDSPGPQGYAIGVFHERERSIIAAIGSDDLGTMYACMTLRQLIVKRDNSVVLLGASVRDWPAFTRRCLGSIGRTFRGQYGTAGRQDPREAYVETWKAYIRFLGRQKINMANLSVSSAMGDDVRKELMDYGRAYGLKYRYIFGTAINEDLKATGTPWTDCVLRQTARHCWSATEAHLHKAARIADLVHEMGYDYVVLHVTDSGGLPDPEKWSERCERCRERYGDDQARAVSEQLKLYHDAIKQRNPNILFEAVLQPYHFQWTTDAFEADPMAAADDMPHYGHTRGMEDPVMRHAAVARATAIHRATSALLPDDVLVTFREAGRAEFDGCAALWPRHPIDIWVYYGRNQAWEGLWEPQVRFTKTWVRSDDPGDVLYNAPVGRLSTVNEVYAAGTVEYTWNTEQPDAQASFDICRRRYNTGGAEVSDYQCQSLLPRLCRLLWGRSGQAVLPLFANNISFNYVSHPEYVASTRGENFEDVYQHWPATARLLEQAQAAINKEVARIDAGEPSGIYGDLRREPGYTTFMWLYYYTNLAAVKCRIESAVLKLQELVAEDEIEKAEALAQDLQRSRLPQWLHEVKVAKDRLADNPRVSYRPRWRSPPSSATKPTLNSLNGPYFDEAPERIAALVPRLLRSARLGAIPDHLRRWLSERNVEAAKVEFRNPFRADGGRGEGGWTNTRPVEFFTITGRASLARYPTRAWVVWDDTALSIMAEMIDEPTAKAVARTKEHDGSLFEDDCFEVFVKPAGGGGKYFHFAVNAAGTTFDNIEKQPAAAWNPAWQAGVSSRTGHWSAELRIPFEVLGGAPRDGDRWQINLARNRAPKRRSARREVSSIIDAPNHHAVDKFPTLVFRADRVGRLKSASLKLREVTRRDVTVTYGFATQLAVRPEIIAWVQATDVTVNLEVYEGERLVKSQSRNVALLPGYWLADRPIDMDLGDVFRGDLRVVVTAVSADKTLNARAEFIVGTP